MASNDVLSASTTSPTGTLHFPTQRFDWRLFALLGVLAAVGAAAVIPYQLAVSGDAVAEAGLTTSEFVAVTWASGTLLALAGCAAGLLLGRRVGLGAPLLAELVRGRVDLPAWRRLLAVAAAAGAATALMILAADLLLAPYLPTVDTGEAGLAVRYVGSLYGAVNEELLLRLGVLTAVVWAGTRLMRIAGSPPAWLLWSATVVAAVAFGILHLPAVATLVELTPLVVLRTVGMNAVLGVVFGRLYVTRGLAAAMVAHFAADLIIQTGAWAIT